MSRKNFWKLVRFQDCSDAKHAPATRHPRLSPGGGWGRRVRRDSRQRVAARSPGPGSREGVAWGYVPQLFESNMGATSAPAISLEADLTCVAGAISFFWETLSWTSEHWGTLVLRRCSPPPHTANPQAPTSPDASAPAPLPWFVRPVHSVRKTDAHATLAPALPCQNSCGVRRPYAGSRHGCTSSPPLPWCSRTAGASGVGGRCAGWSCVCECACYLFHW